MAGIIDEMGLVEVIGRQIEPHPQQIVSTGVAIKAMILNGLGFVSAPLYWFEQFFIGKATEHLLEAGITAEHLNDDRLGRALDAVWKAGLSGLFVAIAMPAYQRFGVSTQSLHLDSSSRFSVTGAYSSSEQRHQSDLKQLDKQLDKQAQKAQKQLRYLRQQTFAYAVDAKQAAQRLADQWLLHPLSAVTVEQQAHYDQAGCPTQGQMPSSYSFHLQAEVVPSPPAIALAQRRAGRLILATNVLDATNFTTSQVLTTYKDQQAPERGVRFLKDPFGFHQQCLSQHPFTSSSTRLRHGPRLMVYTLAQRQLRQALAAQGETIPNQLGKPTAKPTLRWVFMCFQAGHLLQWERRPQISHLTDTRAKILGFFGAPRRKYYLLC